MKYELTIETEAGSRIVISQEGHNLREIKKKISKKFRPISRKYKIVEQRKVGAVKQIIESKNEGKL